MQIDFFVDSKPVEFYRDAFSGRAEIRSEEGVILLQDPMNPGTHFSIKLTKSWSCNISGLEVVIESPAPLFAGFRPSKYRVFVQGELRAEKDG